MKPDRTGADALVDVLAKNGVSHVFGIPGEHCLGIVDSISHRDDIRFVSVRHESAAGFMAEAYGKLTGAPAACLGTASVGAANLIAGVNVAHHDSTPMVVLIGQVSTAYGGREAWQEIDIVTMFGPISRSAVEVARVDRLPEATLRALALSRSGRPGPAVLSVPVDVQDADCVVPTIVSPRPRPPAPDVDGLREVVELLRTASAPLVVVGGGIRNADGAARLARFAEEVRVPVVTAFRRTDAFPNDSDYYIGALGLSASAEVIDAVRSADLLLAVGTRLSELTTLRYTFPSPEQRMVHIDVDARTLAAQATPAQVQLVSDAGQALAALTELCAEADVSGPEPWWKSQRAVREQLEDVGEAAASPSTTIRQIASSIDRLLPDDAVVTSDAGDFFLDCAPFISFDRGRRYLGPTSGTMGYGLPAAIAAKLAQPSSACVALCGDGGLMMSIQELETAVRVGIGVVVVVFNNNAYGSIVRHQAKRYGGNSVGVYLENPPFADLGRLFGATGLQVRTPDQFADGFARALGSVGVTVIEVRLATP